MNFQGQDTKMSTTISGWLPRRQASRKSGSTGWGGSNSGRLSRCTLPVTRSRARASTTAIIKQYCNKKAGPAVLLWLFSREKRVRRLGRCADLDLVSE
jgi:hypothetical protein